MTSQRSGKRAGWLLALSLLTAGACAADASYAAGPAGTPGYVHTYASGGCWADSAWYDSCPWAVGNQTGYHYRYKGQYYYQPNQNWAYQPSSPPPRTWIAPPAPGSVPIDNPRVVVAPPASASGTMPADNPRVLIAPPPPVR